ncbi:MAG TPA: DHH family phosphoesterase [Nitrososphaerales archaeon]|nr:DHH family phosphoesterase [Nitrososphaerales archaeon]
MPDLEGLKSRYDSLAPEVLRLARSGRRIIVVTHIDADGLCSGSIMFSALMRKGANVVLRTVPELDTKVIAELGSQKFDYYIFTDLASTLVQELEAAFDGRFLVVDHHQLAAEDMVKPSVVNAWSYGYDGGREACSSAMAYFFATALDPANVDLAPLAVLGALADRQDSGSSRSLTGLNESAAEQAQSAGLLTISRDLIFSGRETRPIHEAVALTSSPYLAGLTGNKDAVLNIMHQSGIPLKDGGSWRTVSSLTTDEKMRLTELIAGAVGSSEGATGTLMELVGTVYTFVFEDSFTPLRDAREFGTLLNSCGRMRVAGAGIALCLGDRSEALRGAMKILSDYRGAINGAIQALTSDRSRFDIHGHLVFVKGEGTVEERLLGPVISILASTPEFKDKVLVGRASSGESDLKYSARVGDLHEGDVNLGSVMRVAAEAAGGVGGGHNMAAGAKIQSSRAEAFSKSVLEQIPN